jgi:hypothetical protein
VGTEDFFLQNHKFMGQGRMDGILWSNAGTHLGKRAQAALLENKLIFDRLISITLCIPLPQSLADSDVVIDLFYSSQQSQLSISRPQDIVIIMGDLNAKVGSVTSAGGTADGPFGNSANERAEQLLHFCNINGLVITNTFQQWKANRLWAWESQGGGANHNQIDYIIVNRRWKSSVTNCRAFPGADDGSDNHLLIASFGLKLKKRENVVNERTFDVRKLKDLEVADVYRPSSEIKWLDAFLVNKWQNKCGQRVKAFNNTTKSVLGHPMSGQQKDWISSETYKLTEERRALKAHKQDSRSTAMH